MSNFKCPRRDFLKMTAAGAAGLALLRPSSVHADAGTGWPSTGAITINPHINNLRVVSCHDPLMITSQSGLGCSNWSFAGWNAAVNSARIMNNLDQMAMQLAQKTTAAEAWSTIFQKPASKTWSQVNVAIKVNLLSTNNQPRLVIVQKICQILNGYGVPAAQIIIYDCSTGSTTNNQQMGAWKSSFSQGTSGSTLIPGVTSNGNASLGGYTNVAVTGLANGSQNCATSIANGTIDIIVNIAVNKSHSAYAGGTTLCLKNHFGTFAPDHSPSDASVPVNILAMNKSPQIVGGTPARQQLCIVDALWGDKNSQPTGNPTQRCDRLVMGTFAGAVDYFTVVKIQQAVMNSTMCTSYPTFLTSFGYTATDSSLQWIEIAPTATIPKQATDKLRPYSLEVRLLSNGGFANIPLPESAGSVEIRMFNTQGRSIKKMRVMLMGKKTIVNWDGKKRQGTVCNSGKLYYTGFRRRFYRVCLHKCQLSLGLPGRWRFAFASYSVQTTTDYVSSHH